MDAILAPSQAAEAAQIEEQWDEFVTGRYREGKSETEFRVYDAAAVPTVAEFYRLNSRLMILCSRKKHSICHFKRPR
jgi:hypothetical protein